MTRRRQDLAGAAAAAVLLLAAFTLALHPVATTDFFWQLRTGEWILDEGRIPRADPFSYTARGEPWIDLHWGFQILLALLYRVAGLDGLVLARGLLAAGLAALLLFGFAPRGGVRLSALLAVLLALVVAHERLLLRPELLSFLLLGAFLILLERRVRGGAGRSVWLLVPLLVVWVNLHSLFLLGPAVIGIVLAGEAADRIRGGWEPLRPERQPPRRATLAALGGLLVAAPAAALLNPFGLRAYALPWLQYSRRIAPGNLYAGSIAEFQQPFDPSTGGFAIVGAWLLALLLLLLAAVRGRRMPTRHLLLAIAFGLLAWRARRNLPLFAIAAVPVLIEGWRGWARSMLPSRWRPAAAAAGRGIALLAGFVLLGVVCTGRFYRWERMDRRFGSGVQEGVAAAGAADRLAEGDLPGPIFHTLDDGGYLIWRLWPGRRVHIDGRLEVYPEAVYREYLEALRDPSRFESLAARYGIRTVVWNPSQALIAHRLLGYLARSDRWRLVYTGAHSVLFHRSDGPDPAAVDLDAESPAAVIDRGRLPPTALDRFLRRLLPVRRDPPTTAIRLGILHGLIDQPRQAENYLLLAAEGPAPPEVHYDLGLLYDRIGLPERAVLAYEEALQASRWYRDPFGLLFRPGFGRDLRVRLGDAYVRAGMEERGRPLLERGGPQGRARLLALDGFRLQEKGEIAAAVETYRRALRLDPENPEVHHNLGLALIAAAVAAAEAGGDPRPDLEEAARSFESAIGLRPGFASGHFNLGLIRLQQGRTGEAEARFEEAIRLEPENAGYRFQLGSIRLQAGRLEAAAADLQEAVRLQPDFPPAQFQLGLARQAQGRLEEALEAYRRAHELGGGGDPQVLLRIAWVQALRGETGEALEWLRRVPLPEPRLRNLLQANPDLAPLVAPLFGPPEPVP